MGDIFSDIKKDEEKETDSNIEWKKSGIDKHERLSLKINVQAANIYNASKSNDLKAQKKIKGVSKAAQGFKKVNKRIKDVYDEEDEEDDYIVIPVFEKAEETSLMNALSEEEKKFLEQSERFHATKQQENVGKESAIEYADRLIKQAGLGHLNSKQISQERSKNGLISNKEVVADVLKQKLNKHEMLRSSASQDANAKVMSLVKELNKNKNNSKQTNRNIEDIESKLKNTQQHSEQISIEELPQKGKAYGVKAKEISSIKSDEKIVAEYKEQEFISKKEEKLEPQNAPHLTDVVNQDDVNKDISQKEINQTDKIDNSDKAQKTVIEKDIQQINNEEAIIKEKAKEIVDAEKEQSYDELQTKSKDAKDAKEDTYEIKELIKEKSGRSHKISEKIEKDKTPTRMSEKEYQKALEQQINKYQDREI